jgi:hypothetical protein
MNNEYTILTQYPNKEDMTGISELITSTHNTFSLSMKGPHGAVSIIPPSIYMLSLYTNGLKMKGIAMLIQIASMTLMLG